MTTVRKPSLPEAPRKRRDAQTIVLTQTIVAITDTQHKQTNKQIGMQTNNALQLSAKTMSAQGEGVRCVCSGEGFFFWGGGGGGLKLVYIVVISAFILKRLNLTSICSVSVGSFTLLVNCHSKTQIIKKVQGQKVEISMQSEPQTTGKQKSEPRWATPQTTRVQCQSSETD